MVSPKMLGGQVTTLAVLYGSFYPPVQILTSRAFVALALFGIGGCITVEHFPSSWGAVPTGGQCESVAGAYESKGARADGTVVSLASWLNPTLHSNNPEQVQMVSDLAHAQTVELSLAATSLNITAIEGTARRTWTLDSSKGQFRCRDGAIRLARWHVDNDIVLMASKDTMDLYRTEDYLLVNVHGGGAGLAMVVPAAGYSSTWARFHVREQVR